MKLLKVVFENLPLLDRGVELDFFSEGRVSEDEQHELIHLFKNYYANRTMTLTGLNASGKTQVLNCLAVALTVIQAKSINSFHNSIFEKSSNQNILHLVPQQETIFIIYFYEEINGEGFVYKLESKIGVNFDEADGCFKYEFVEEVLSRKSTKYIRSKKDMFTFISLKKDDVVMRSNNEIFSSLPSDISMMSYYIQTKVFNKLYSRDTLSFTNVNFLRNSIDLPKELISYFDPSIEELSFLRNEESRIVLIRVKFFGQDDVIELESVFDLPSVLSSGTIKGIGLFMDAFAMLSSGGIVIVDELENHFNREIVSTFINLFLDRKLNPHGAVLIYTTHYSELLDLIPRNDSIYILSKDKRIRINKFSKSIQRNDISKGDLIMKGIVANSAPSYASENALKKVFKKEFLKK